MNVVVHGVAIRPGVSRNRRRYTSEALRKAQGRLTARLASPAARPVTMRTFHPDSSAGPGSSVTSIVGRVTKATLLSDGSIAYEATLADTPEAKTVAALVKPDASGRQHLSSVSIRGWWVGETRQDRDGCETGDDLEIDGLDLTDTPGVETASIAPGAMESSRRPFIFESVEEAFVDATDIAEAAIAEARRLRTIREAAEAAAQRVETATTESERREAQADAWSLAFALKSAGTPAGATWAAALERSEGR